MANGTRKQGLDGGFDGSFSSGTLEKVEEEKADFTRRNHVQAKARGVTPGNG